MKGAVDNVANKRGIEDVGLDKIGAWSFGKGAPTLERSNRKF